MTDQPDTQYMIERSMQETLTNMGLSLIDIATVIHVLKVTNGPQTLITCLESAQAQINVAGGSLAAAQAGLLAMEAERDTALEALAQSQYDMEIFNRNNPAVAKLIDEVWAAAVRDTLKKVNRRSKGA